MNEESVLRRSLVGCFHPENNAIRAIFQDSFISDLTKDLESSLRTCYPSLTSLGIMCVSDGDVSGAKNILIATQAKRTNDQFVFLSSRISHLGGAAGFNALCGCDSKPCAADVVTVASSGINYFLIGAADGSVKLYSTAKLYDETSNAETTGNFLAGYSFSDKVGGPILAIHSSPCPAEVIGDRPAEGNNSAAAEMIMFFVVFPSSVEGISCVIDGPSASVEMTLTASLRWDPKAMGSFSRIELLDSKYGRGSFAALHLQKGSGSGSGPSQPSVAVVVPIDARALWQHSDKVLRGEAAQASLYLGSEVALQVCVSQGESAVFSAVDQASICTWTAAAGASLDGLFSSFSFSAVAVGSNRGYGRARFTTAQQWVIDSLIELGVEALAHPNSTLTFPPDRQSAKNIESESEVILFKDAAGNHILVSSTLPKLPASLAAIYSSLWRACLLLGLSAPWRSEGLHKDPAAASASASSVTGTDYSDTMDADVEVGRFQRRVVMEAAVAAGASSIVAEYVLAPASPTDGYGLSGDGRFLLRDVATVYRWAAAVYHEACDVGFKVTTAYVAPWLLRKNQGTDGDSDSTGAAVATGRRTAVEDALLEELAASASTCRGVVRVVEALLQRKELVFSQSEGGGGGDNGDQTQGLGPEAKREHARVVRELKRFLAQLWVLVGVLRLVAALCRDKVLSLACLSPSSARSLAAARLERLALAPEMSFLPESLISDGLLFDDLVSRLPAQVAHTAALPGRGSMEGDGDRDGAGYQSLCRAIADLLWLPLASVDAVARAAASSSSSDDGSAGAAGNSVVLYVLLDAYSLSLSASAGGPTAADYDSFSVNVAEAVGMPSAQRLGLLSLWRTDTRTDVSAAVRDLGSPLLGLHKDDRTLEAITKRLLFTGERAAAKSLLQRLQPSSGFLRTPIGLLALAAAGTCTSTWQITWQQIRRLSSDIDFQGGAEVEVEAEAAMNEAEGEAADNGNGAGPLVLRRAMAAMLCRWALLEGEGESEREREGGSKRRGRGRGNVLEKFLGSVFEEEEEREVASVLGEGAEAEIAEGAFPSPAVDTLAFWLVRRRRTDAALAVHQRHRASLSLRAQSQSHSQSHAAAVGGDVNVDDAVAAAEAAVAARSSILEGFKSLPQLPTRPYRLSREML